MTYAVDNLDVETYHSAAWSHEKPAGFPFWIFLHVVTPQYVNQGEELILAREGACIIYPPNHPRYLYCPKDADGLTNDWIHFSCDDDAAFSAHLEQIGIPVGRLFALKQTSTIISTMQDIIYEKSVTLPQNESMIDSLVNILIIKISRNVISYNEKVDYHTLQHLQAFERLRKKIYSTPQQEWSITGMANSVYLGQNQFITLYSSFFGVTPKQDIINARISKAKSLLGSGTIMHDVAIACGFKNEFYFSTVFKKHTGTTPSQYARAYVHTYQHDE